MAARLVPFAVLAALALATWGATRILDDYLIILAAIILTNVMLAVSLSLTNGLTGLFSLGHPAFMTVGGYVAAIMTFPAVRKGFMMPELPGVVATAEWGLLPATLLGGAVAAVFALIVGFPVLRLRGHYLAVATLGMIIIVKTLVNNMDGYTRGGLGLNGLPQLSNLWWVSGWAALTVLVCWRVKHSSFGRSLMAIRENEMAAECIGISAAAQKIAVFTLGAFFAGVAGGLLAHLITVITPGTYSIVLAFNLVLIIVVGGSGSLTGAVVAAIAVGLISEALRPLEESLELYGLSQVLVAFALILVLIFRPRGLFGNAEPAWARFIMGQNSWKAKE